MRGPNGRTLAIGAEAHAVSRALIDAFLAVGALPDDEALARVTGLAVAAVRAALGALVAGDWAGRDEAGAIVALYPFSIVPTPVRVRVGESERYAMCAIDALGVAPMLDAAIGIESSCQVCGAAITLTVGPTGVRACLPETVVGVGLGLPLGWGKCYTPARETTVRLVWLSRDGDIADRCSAERFFGWCGCVKGATPERLLGIS